MSRVSTCRQLTSLGVKLLSKSLTMNVANLPTCFSHIVAQETSAIAQKAGVFDELIKGASPRNSGGGDVAALVRVRSFEMLSGIAHFFHEHLFAELVSDQ